MAFSNQPDSLPFADDGQALALCRAFADCSLPKAAWTHRAHLAVALWHLDRLPFERALSDIRHAIKRYNHAVGTVDTTVHGYHETITRFYMRMAERFRRDWRGARGLAARANAFYEQFGDRELPLRHYSRNRLFSVEARARWVEPDLDPIP